MGSVKIPNSVTEIAASAFEGCLNMNSVDIPDALKTLGDWGFCSCPSLTSIVLPSSLTSIGKRAFLYCSSLREITNFSTIPQSLIVDEFGVFGDVDKTSCILRVPMGTRKLYQAADTWKDFLNIDEFDATGIRSAILDVESGEVPIYNLQGVRMKEAKENLPVGIYIQGGKKIIVK